MNGLAQKGRPACLLRFCWLMMMMILAAESLRTTPIMLSRRAPTRSLTFASTNTRLGIFPPCWSSQDQDSNRENNDIDLPPYGELYSNVFDTSLVDDNEPTDDDLRFAFDTQKANFVDGSLKWGPVFIPFVAYITYDPTASFFAFILDTLSQNSWVAVDGGAYQAKIIAPAINGIVVPAMSILFANLIGNTIYTLRQRQQDIRTCLNLEAGQIRILQNLLDVFPPSVAERQASCRRYLVQYTSRLIAESQPTVEADFLDFSQDTELNGFLAEINRLTQEVGNPDTSSLSSSSSPGLAPLTLDHAFSACSRLYDERARRITALRNFFPPLHFIIVSTLAFSICVAFLLESKQDILVFLNAIQLRILWTMLVGTFCALAIVCYDLTYPFRGSYQISKAVDQLYTIRMTLRASLRISSSSNTIATHDSNNNNNHVSKRNSTEMTIPLTNGEMNGSVTKTS